MTTNVVPFANQRATRDRVVDVVATILGKPSGAGAILDRHDLVDDLGADSLVTVEILNGLEVAFDIRITDEEFHEVRTVGDAVALVERLEAARG